MIFGNLLSRDCALLCVFPPVLDREIQLPPAVVKLLGKLAVVGTVIAV